MPDLGTQIGVARQAGYSDADITAYLAKDPSLGPKVAQAKAAGYSDSEIADHLASSAPPPKENVFQKAARLTGEAYHQADQALRADAASVAQKANSGQSPSLLEQAKPALDAVSAGTAPIKGVADATFGDKPVHLPPKVFGVDVPEWAQNINRNGLTGGDIAQLAIPVVGELNALRTLSKAADAAGVSTRTMREVVASSKAPASVTRPPQAPPQNSLAAKVQAFDQAGVRPSLAAATGGGNAAVANSVAENALAGGAARANMAAQVKDVQNSASRIGARYGQAADRTAAGEAVQQGVKDFNQRFSDRAEALYDKAFANIDAGMSGKTDAPRTATVFDDTGTHQIPVGGSQITTPATLAVLGGMGQAQSQAIANVIKDPTISRVAAAVQDANKAKDLSFQDLRDLRTWVRTAQDNTQLRQDIGAANLQRLEGALTQDINTNAATLAGPKAARQLQQADQFYRLGSQRIQNSLQAFVGKDNLAPAESAYDRVIRAAGNTGGADSARLLALKNSLKPSEWGDVAASVIDRMGAPSKGAANANEAGGFSLANFVSNYAGLSERGKALLFGPKQAGGLRSELDNLVNVAGDVKAVEKGANASKSGVSVQNVGTLSGLGSAGTAMVLHHPAPLLTAGAALGGMNLTGHILTSPEAVRWLARIGKAEKVSPAAVSSALGRLKAQAALNPALVPVYAEAARAFGTPALPAAATTTSPAQSTPPPNN